MSITSLKTPSNKANTGEFVDLLGPCIQFLTPLSDDDDEYCLMRRIFPAGVVVPVHSHDERETFYVLEGEIDGLWDDRWGTFRIGDVVDVPGGLKHAWRNASGASASTLVVVPMRLGRALREFGRLAETACQGAPKPADFQRLLEIVGAYGYWIGSPAYIVWLIPTRSTAAFRS